jgi:hypothetical protein
VAGLVQQISRVQKTLGIEAEDALLEGHPGQERVDDSRVPDLDANARRERDDCF